ncbi:MAG: M14 family zinc carboxypeptidase [Alphaproteobacteria bacterium]
MTKIGLPITSGRRKCRGHRTGLLAGVLAVLAASVLSLSPARAEPIDYFVIPGVTYDPAIETPDAFFGHGLGDRPIRHSAMVRYIERLANASPRLSVETIGRTHEGRPILLVAATAAENQARLDDLRQAHLDRPADPDLPVVTFISYGVHGAESAGMDAVLPTLYHLAAARGPNIDALLKGSIIVAVAILNPDGHTRRIDHVERFGGKVAVSNPDHAQHDLWIGARTNHYGFDLNRQWLLLTQPESQAWTGAWQRWKPHVAADFHEMGTSSTYYFHPGAPTRLNPLIPGRSRELLDKIAGYHRRFMDSEAKLFFSEERFDNYYIGKGSTYPHVQGSIGILFEAGAARGGKIESRNGLRTYADNIRTHFRTSLTTIEGAFGEAETLKEYRRSFIQDTERLARRDETRAYVFDAPGDPVRRAMFVDLLTQHDIRAYRLSRDLAIGEHGFKGGEAVVVPLSQPQYRLIKGIMEPVLEFADPVFYDVSGWTLPLAYGLRHEPLARSTYSAALLGADVREGETQAPAAPPVARYGYMFDWSHFHAPRALYRLLDAGLLVRAAFVPVTVETSEGQVDFGRGSIFVPFDRQTVSRETIHALVSELGERDGIPVHAVASGVTPNPGRDLGAPDSFRPLNKPEILLLYTEGGFRGGGLARYDMGEVWHLLDHRMEIPVTLRDARTLMGVDWSRYSHIIMAGGRMPLDETARKRLQRWVREDGGTLIAARGLAKTVQDLFLKPGSQDQADSGETEPTPEESADRFDYAELNQRNAEHVIGGAIFGGDLDITHPLGFGYSSREIASQRNTTIVLDAPDNPVATVVRYTDEPLLSGYASEKRVGEIKGTPMMIADRVGAGAVVVMTDNLNFRATFLGTAKLFLNALFFADQIERPRSDEEAVDVH